MHYLLSCFTFFALTFNALASPCASLLENANRQSPEKVFTVHPSVLEPDFAPAKAVPPIQIEIKPSITGFAQYISRIGPDGNRGTPILVNGDGKGEALAADRADPFSVIGLSLESLERYRDKRILSLGSGLSQLVPILAAKGYSVRGLDLWYDESLVSAIGFHEWTQYFQQNRRFLRVGDATHIPYADQSLDLVVSTYLLNNLPHEAARDVIKEVIRVLRVGGEARMEPCPAWVRDYITEHYGAQIRAEWPRGLSSFLDDINDSGLIPQFGLLVLRKVE